MYTKVLSLYVYLLIPYEAMEPKSRTKAMEMVVTNKLLAKYREKPLSIHTVLYVAKEKVSGRENGVVRMARLVLNEERTMLISG
jgi:hypothetical protein